MGPLANKAVIEKLAKEKDDAIIAEVLDFYEYVKYKKHKQLWDNIEEDELQEDEKDICNKYLNEEQELMSLDTLVQELGLEDE